MCQFAANRLRGNAAAHLFRFIVEQLHRECAQLHTLVMEVCTFLQLGKATGFLKKQREWKLVKEQQEFKRKVNNSQGSPSSLQLCISSYAFLLHHLLTLFKGCTAICLLGLGGAAAAAAVGGLQLDSVEAFEICDAFIEPNIS